jgi:hypothetical protein
MSDKHYVVLKLISGETLMATFESEDDKYVKVDKPITIRTIVIPELNKESITATPYCPFSESTSFVLEKNHIIYIKKLHTVYIPHYKNFLESYEDAMLPTTKKQIQEEEGFDDLEELSLEEIQRRLDLLEAIATAPRDDLSEEEKDERVFVKGNSTKH